MTHTPVFSCGYDDFGIYVRFCVDGDVYSDTAILKTAYWFTDRYYLFISKQKEGNQYKVEIRPKEEVPSEILEKTCGDFHNYLLDQEVRQKVIQETATVRDTLIKKAFFEAKASFPVIAISAEAHIPDSTASYLDDPVHIERTPL